MFRNNSKFSWSLFLFGLGSQLQLLGTSLSITESFVLASFPFVVFHEWPYMKRNRVLTLFWLAAATVVGCVIASFVNHTGWWAMLRGMAVTVIMTCSIVVGHWLLRRNMNGFKWMLLGVALSGIISTFYFMKSVEVSRFVQTGLAATAEDIMSGPIFWISRIRPFAMLIPTGWYLQCPILVSALVPVAFGLFAILRTASGRSAALSALAAAALVLVGGKRQRTIMRVCRNFWKLMLVSVVAVFLAKNLYSLAASSGWLGEKSRLKYEKQTQGDTSMMKLLLGGRMESFCGLLACVDKPIVGFGPWAIDRDGYTSEFLRRYGTYEDYENILRVEADARERGQQSLIPCHAYITEFWLWYGISGLLFWLYVLFVFARFLRQDCWVVPQWYMWLAAGIPGYCWGIFFSPLGERAVSMMFIVACLMARAVRLGMQPLPNYMKEEIFKVEAK